MDIDLSSLTDELLVERIQQIESPAFAARPSAIVLREKPIILAQPRSGSSNLLRFIARAANVRLDYEPFNLGSLSRTVPDWRDRTDDALAAAFNRTMKSTGIAKHIYGQFGPRSRIDRLVSALASVGAIIFLYRKNVAAAALSGAIAKAIDDYHSRPTNALGPIAVEDVQALVEDYGSRWEAALEVASLAGRPIRAISYEALFHGPEETRKKTAAEVIAFLRAHSDLPTVSEERFEAAFAEYMMPDKRLNGLSSYTLIENAQEIRAAFPGAMEP